MAKPQPTREARHESITNTTPGTVVPFQKLGTATQTKPGGIHDATMQARREGAGGLSVCDDAHTEAHLVNRTLRALMGRKHHGAERLWM